MDAVTAKCAIRLWSEASDMAREKVTDVLDAVMELADGQAGPLMVVVRDLLDAAAAGALISAEEALVASVDIEPETAS